MKKFVVWLSVLLLFVVPAMAQAQEIVEIDWEDYKGGLDSTATHGDFIDIEEAGIRLFIPELLNPMDLPEALSSSGYLAYFRSDDYSMMVVISKETAEGKTPADFVEEMRGYIPEIELTGRYKINGIDAAIFEDPSHDERDCILKPSEEFLIRVSVQPVSEYVALMLSDFVFASVQMLGD